MNTCHHSILIAQPIRVKVTILRHKEHRRISEHLCQRQPNSRFVVWVKATGVVSRSIVNAHSLMRVGSESDARCLSPSCFNIKRNRDSFAAEFANEVQYIALARVDECSDIVRSVCSFKNSGKTFDVDLEVKLHSGI